MMAKIINIHEQEELKGGWPLLDSQKGIYFLSHKQKGSSVYNMINAYKLEGQLKVENLFLSVQKVIERHSALRTYFTEQNDDVIQIIAEKSCPSYRVEHLDEDFSEPRARQYLREESHQNFDLSKAPLIRFSLVYFRNNTCLLIVTIHHIIGDHLSCNIVMEDIARYYNAYCKGDELNLEKPSQYHQYIQWRQSESEEKYKQFWKEELEGCPSITQLPYDFERGSDQTFDGQTYAFSLPNALSLKISDFCKNNKITPFMFFMSIYSLFLSKTDQRKRYCDRHPYIQ